MKTRNKKGFTLIELLVVISIIAMLSSIVLASVNGARQKAIIAAKIGLIKQYVNAIAIYNTVNNSYPTITVQVNLKCRYDDGSGTVHILDSGCDTACIGYPSGPFYSAAIACFGISGIPPGDDNLNTQLQTYIKGSTAGLPAADQSGSYPGVLYTYAHTDQNDNPVPPQIGLESIFDNISVCPGISGTKLIYDGIYTSRGTQLNNARDCGYILKI